MTPPVYSSSQIRQELAALRKRDVDGYVVSRISAVDGDCSTERIEEWEREAYRRWREQFPTLNDLFIPNVAVSDD